MALLTAQHSGPADILCSAAHGSSPLSGMTLMYALMSVRALGEADCQMTDASHHSREISK